jgi:uncharacterized membrane protein
MTRWAALAIAASGAAIAGYLALAGPDPACVIARGCSVVQSSSYAKLAGVPVAALGLGGYLVLLAALWRDTETARTLAAAVALTGAGFSGWLTYVEVFRLEAICAWCVASAVCMTALAVLCTVRMLRAPSGVDPSRSTTQGGEACT